jgi:hypothetical protein
VVSDKVRVTAAEHLTAADGTVLINAMSGLGVHFAVTPAQAKALLAAKSDRALMVLVEEIEDAWEEPYVVETDKAWNAIQRCLTDGTLLYVSGDYPLNHCICGGRQLVRRQEYTVSFVTAPQVKDVAAALGKVTKAWMRKRYDKLDPEDYDEVEIGDEDFAYTWKSFLDVRRFYKRAAEAGRAVIFTVD